MSEFRGECRHLVRSNGYCEECKRIVRIVSIDGMTSREQQQIDDAQDDHESSIQNEGEEP